MYLINQYNKEENFSLSEHLSHREYRCRCSYQDCTYTLVNDKLLHRFESLRKYLALPLYILSGYRCQRHNGSTEVGGAKDSQHKRGNAIDIACPRQMDFEEFALACKDHFPFTIAYKDRNFVHCDVRID